MNDNCPHECLIPTKGDPFKLPCQRMIPKQREIIVTEFIEMLKVGIIAPSRFLWASCLVVGEKADGTWSTCVPNRKLNDMTIRDCYPLLNIDNVLHRVSRRKCSCSLTWSQDFEKKKRKNEDME